MSSPCRREFPRRLRPFRRAGFPARRLRPGWQQFEARYSRFIPDSLIGRINAAAGDHWVEIDPETDGLFNLCQDLVFPHARFI